MHDENNTNDNSEEEPLLISLNEALKSLQTWITFFDQQQLDEFSIKNDQIFKKYLKIVKRLELQSQKQVSITNFFSSHESNN